MGPAELGVDLVSECTLLPNAIEGFNSLVGAGPIAGHAVSLSGFPRKSFFPFPGCFSFSTIRFFSYG